MGQEPAPAPAEDQEPAATAKPDDKPSGEPSGFDALPAETQEEIRKLRAESAKWRTEAQQRQEKLEEREEADKSEVEKAQGKLTKAEERAKVAEAALLRFQVAAEKQIPADAVELLTGNTREELEAKADKLLSLVKNRSEDDTKPDFDGGAREPAPDPDSPDIAHNKAIMALMGLAPPN